MHNGADPAPDEGRSRACWMPPRQVLDPRIVALTVDVEGEAAVVAEKPLGRISDKMFYLSLFF